jgi:hypothetical protein
LLSLQVGSPLPPPAQGGRGGSEATSMPLALAVGVSAGGAVALALLLIVLLLIASRQQRHKRAPSSDATVVAAGIGGTNPMQVARALRRNPPAAMRRTASAQQKSDAAAIASMSDAVIPGSGGSGSAFSPPQLTNPIFGSSQRRVAKPPAHSHGTSSQLSAHSQASSGGSSSALDAPLGTFNAFKSNPLHRKHSSKGSVATASPGPGRSVRTAKSDSDPSPPPGVAASRPVAVVNSDQDNVAMVESPLRSHRALTSPPLVSVLRKGATGSAPISCSEVNRGAHFEDENPVHRSECGPQSVEVSR